MPEFNQELANRFTAPIVGLPEHLRYRLGFELFNQTRRILKTPPRPRPSAIANEVRKLSKLSPEKLAAELPNRPHLWAELGVETQYELSDLTSDLQAAHDAVATLAAELELDLTIQLDGRGGRHRDERIDRLVYTYWKILERYMPHASKSYRETAQTRPTITVDPETGALTSPFGDLVTVVLEELAPELAQQRGAIRLAVQTLVECERDGLAELDWRLAEQLPDPRKT